MHKVSICMGVLCIDFDILATILLVEGIQLIDLLLQICLDLIKIFLLAINLFGHTGDIGIVRTIMNGAQMVHLINVLILLAPVNHLLLLDVILCNINILISEVKPVHLGRVLLLVALIVLFRLTQC
jgi:hypothetical protein